MKMTPIPDNRQRQTLRVRLRNSRQRLCGIRGGNWQKPKPGSTAKRKLLPASTPPMSAVSARNKPGAARCPMWRNARAVGQICPTAGERKAITAKTAPRDIRGVSQGRRRLRTAANETVRSVTTQAQIQTHAQKIRLAAQKVAGGTGKTAVAVRSAIRNFLADLHSLTAILAAGASFALSIVIIISLVAFVSGSAYGIFFAADAPNAASVTVREAVDTLTEEYRDRLEEISDTVQHDRQDIVANDDVYYIRWQDVLAVFSSYVAGSEQGAPVAALTEEQVDKLRETMWAMNAVDYSTHPETTTIDTTDEDGNPTTTEITETVLVIELTHKTPAEMAADYHLPLAKAHTCNFCKTRSMKNCGQNCSAVLHRAVENL